MLKWTKASSSYYYSFSPSVLFHSLISDGCLSYSGTSDPVG